MHLTLLLTELWFLQWLKDGIECILGAKIDPVFGPIVMFGLGGIYAEVMKDIAFAEAPVSIKKLKK